jgi:hypothetical protein
VDVVGEVRVGDGQRRGRRRATERLQSLGGRLVLGVEAALAGVEASLARGRLARALCG